MMELPSAPAESDTHPIERLPVHLRVLRCPTRLSATVPPTSRVPPLSQGHQNPAREEAYRLDTILNQPDRCRVSIKRLKHVVDSQLVASLDDESGPTLDRKTLPNLCPKNRFRRECVPFVASDQRFLKRSPLGRIVTSVIERLG